MTVADSREEIENQPPIDVSDPKYDPHILDYLQLVLKYKWTVTLIVFACGVVALASTFMVPQVYQASAMLLPPDRLSSFGRLSRFSSGFAISMLKEIENPSVDLLQNILESRQLNERVLADSAIYSFLRSHTADREEMLNEVHHSIAVIPGISQVEVQGVVETGWFASSREKAQAQKLSAYVANRAIAEMDSIMRAEVRSLARGTRIYADSDYASRSRELDSIESVREDFERTHGVVELTKQTKATIERVAALRAARDEAQIRLQILRLDLTQQASPTQAVAALASEANRAAESYASAAPIGPAFDSLPSINQEYARILQRKQELEPIVSFLRGEVEQQRVFEAREKSVITIMDSAMPPKGKASPKRAITTLLGLISGLGIGIFYVGVRAIWPSWIILRSRESVV
jgi:tyrosine-protein kinase Etk/Wzc